MNPSSPRPEPFADTLATLNVLHFLVCCTAYVHELTTRRIGSMGREYPNGAVTLGGLFVAPTVAVALVPPTDGFELLLPYGYFLIGLSLVHGVAKRIRKTHVHRHCIGDPWLKIGRGRTGEYVLGFSVSAVLFLLCNSLGVLHGVSLIASSLRVALIEERERRIVQQMKDARLEAETYSDRLNDS